jgi:quinol monooxygenase YgiN
MADVKGTQRTYRLLTEVWTDKAAHDTMTGSEPGRTVTQKIAALLTEPPTGSYGDVLFAFGLGAR